MRADGRGDVTRYRGGQPPAWVLWTEVGEKEIKYFLDMTTRRLRGAVKLVYEVAVLRYISSDECDNDEKVYRVMKIRRLLPFVYKYLTDVAVTKGLDVVELETTVRRRCGI